MDFLKNVTLAPYTTFGIGGPAQHFAEAATEEDLVKACKRARKRGLPLFVLGGGSNLLVSDQGFAGMVLRVALRGIEQQDDRFEVAAGEPWDAWVEHAVTRNYAGLECLAGIPGTVGASPVQNIGAYGQEVAESITHVRALDLETEKFVTLSATECGFAYRESIFNTRERGRYLITRVGFRLHHEAAPTLRYAELAERFAGQPSPNLAQVSAAVREIRARKGMLIVAGDPDCRSAGSFFKNPVVELKVVDRVASRVEGPVPTYPVDATHKKLSAAWLIEQAGFHKGYGTGPAGISSKHTLALVNRGGAKAADVMLLMTEILKGVYKKFGVTLEMEPVVVA